MIQTICAAESCLQTREPYISCSYFSLSLLLAVIALWPNFASGQNYTLSFLPSFSPPAIIPKDPRNLVYSVPLNQLTSRAIIATVLNRKGKIATSLNKNIKVYATSMDKSQKKPTDSDSWRDSGGKLCQWSNPEKYWPARLNRDTYYTVCGSNISSTTLIAKVLKGEIILDWLKHSHPNGTLPPNDRFLRIEIPKLNISLDTNFFKITEPAWRLVITKQPPKNITANTSFDVEAEIQDKNGAPLTVGLDSVAFVELTVCYHHKTFYNVLGKSMILRYTKARLSGPFVTIFKATRDLVFRQRASAGKVSFNDVRILDSVYDMRLNLTMFMSKDPYLRIPDCADCYKDAQYILPIMDYVVFELPPENVLKEIRSMAITNHIIVLPQQFSKLKFSSNFKGTGKMKITRNFPIPGPLTIETQDKNGNRIYSGINSNIPLEVKAVPSEVCLTSDTSILSHEGVASFIGSICEIRKSVFLVFYSKKDPTVNVTSQEIEVEGDVHIAHFDHFEFTGKGKIISPHVNSFVRFAATDVNNGIIPGVLKPFNMKIIIVTIETKDDIANTILQYRFHRETALKDPSRAIHAAILSGKSKINAAIIRELFNQKTTQISLDERSEIYTDFELFNRVCWNSRQIYRSFFQFFSHRHWRRATILKTSNMDLSRSLKRFARSMEVELNDVVINEQDVEWKSKNPDVNQAVKVAMNKIKDRNVKIIACFANHTQIPAILHIAKREGVSSEEGYQWIFVSKYAWDFPFNNTFSCGIIPECTTVFGGTILFTETYNTSFLQTEDWERVLNYYFSVDRSIYLGLDPVYPNTDTSARMALGYDAIWLYAEALTNIAAKRLTATTERITDELRKVTINGLSGTLKLDENGDRDGFQADIRVISATKPREPMEKVAPLYKYIVMTPDKKNFEYVYDDGKNTIYTNETILSIKRPISSVYNIHRFKSKSGRVSKTNFHLIKYSNESWPSTDIYRLERTLPPFTCKIPCGNILSREDINVYNRGICFSMNKCKCYEGYFGTYCEKKVCSCLYGHCDEPNICVCYKGYTGDKCSIPICSRGCSYGNCIKPNKCKCINKLWTGYQCDIHAAAIMVPFIILLILFVYFCYKFIKFVKRYTERAAALSNLEWVVEWYEVIPTERSFTAIKSAIAASTTTHFQGSTYTWKKRSWYVKSIDSNTIDIHDENMRLEIFELININHQNLITYGGACIVHPNVCLLVEFAQKGSLDEILLNETIQLGWNFRFSFIKDICRGMNFLHTKTKIGSHGRLKSSNCLLDNRWCIRITDFGIPTIRCGPYLIEKTDEEKADDYYSKQEALLWTAPELLKTATCLDDVKTGTKEGDVYSFGIIISEITTRDIPYSYERNFLSVCSIIDMLVNLDDPELEEERTVWKSLETGLNVVRPFIRSDYLPYTREEDRFRNILNDIWADDPLQRIYFNKLMPLLDDLFPTKEELMDNLMHLLESYSKNLEQMVIDKTDALEIEKTKVENIVSQMLPKNVIEELKKGNKIEPETFECVTVYYSDIVGFTTIARNIQPLQVVDLLNHLYSVFDNILAEYNVYKVETIGDAYVVASGVPILNDNLHAGEIATASLDVMSAIMTMDVSHLTNAKLQLRLGINTGPVVAGVVGVKMPRYTLFGESMQIASTMESSSKAMRIQMTEYTVNILKELGGYFMMFRQNMSVCGKNIDTYWLTGKRGYRKPLPSFEDD